LNGAGLGPIIRQEQRAGARLSLAGSDREETSMARRRSREGLFAGGRRFGASLAERSAGVLSGLAILGAVMLAAGCEDSAARYNKSGLEAYRAGDYTQARAAFEEAIHNNPDNGDYYFNRGVAEQALGNLRPAIFNYDMAAKLNPGIVRAYQNAAACCVQLGEPQKALAELEKGTQATPYNAQAFINLGKFYLSQGDMYNAKLAMAKAVAADPDSAAAYRDYGHLLIQAGEKAKGIAHLKKSLQLEPIQPGLSAELSKLAPTGDQLPPPKPQTK
jgi:tetratricopeptide (TPR) repeat protein